MRTIVLPAVIASLAVATVLVSGSGSEAEQSRHQERIAWVGRCLAGLNEIRPGMTRAEIERRLQPDGGIQGPASVRYGHRECGYFKIDVEFAVARNPNGQNRAVPSPEDKAVKVSKPYIEQPHID